MANHVRPGLTGRGLPELLMTGVAPARALQLLGCLADSAAEAADAHMNAAIALDGAGVRGLQLVWADRRGRWRWSASFDDGRATRAVLGARAALGRATG
ncbi:hypothetical protein [Mycobacterium sp. 852002-50816_SCH5313054-b]|uniref:hypothetical protein n=1 Tax=Mycobacterium sp. 852002-50816_SCH5313054-b TaxID=1834092 RepID=UPI0008296A1A|nr:hypothetical protein [Mycobacterium sp. 852002-50816_SCH5313054-b]